MHVTPTAITLTLKRHCGIEVEIAWSDIVRITACKQDLFNPQIVVLEIHAGADVWEVDASDCGGFEVFSHILSQRLTSLRSYAEWWPQVIDPLARQESLDLYVRRMA